MEEKKDNVEKDSKDCAVVTDEPAISRQRSDGAWEQTEYGRELEARLRREGKLR